MPYKDPELGRINKRNYYLKRRDELIKRAILWNKENKDKRKVISKRDNEKRKIKKRIWHEQKYFGGSSSIIGIGVCANCKREKPLIIHHMDMDKQNNDPSNHFIICKSCHIRIHKPRRKVL
jgi:hypothetical protein